MRIVIAPDSFKGSLTAVEAAEAIEAGIRSVLPDADIVCLPLADGGEGTVDAWLGARSGRLVTRSVVGPLGESVEAAYGVLDGNDPKTAIVESAAASGFRLVPRHLLNPLHTTTYGTGELIRHALESGCTRVVVGLGGTATNDGGVGALQALGARFVDGAGYTICTPITAAHLPQIASIRAPSRAQVNVVLASDVMNRLTGPDGASAVYGPQKGATPEIVAMLDAGLGYVAEIFRRDFGVDVTARPAAGAAGGLGAALMAWFGAEARSGIDLLLDTCGFDDLIATADWVVTGEGAIDRQTLSGKAVAGVVRRCSRANVRVLAIGGSVDPETADALLALGATGVSAASPPSMEREQAMREARQLVADAVAEAFRTDGKKKRTT
ncbi:MAG: glycerate kinase [Capsulimonadaceae bacterium]